MSSVAANFGNEPHIYELTFASYSTFLPSSLVKGLTNGSGSPGQRANPGMVAEDDFGPLSRPGGGGRFRDKESIRVYNGSFQLQQSCRELS